MSLQTLLHLAITTLLYQHEPAMMAFEFIRSLENFEGQGIDYQEQKA
jgi:hypothetical protein